jgi:hypothetical protein
MAAVEIYVDCEVNGRWKPLDAVKMLQAKWHSLLPSKRCKGPERWEPMKSIRNTLRRVVFAFAGQVVESLSGCSCD